MLFYMFCNQIKVYFYWSNFLETNGLPEISVKGNHLKRSDQERWRVFVKEKLSEFLELDYVHNSA